MKEKLSQLINEKSPGAVPLYLVIRGSHAYGTNIETSDTDYAGVFIQSLDDILGNKYTEQVNDDKNDIVIYELRRFLELLSTNNPNILELLNTPEDCVIYKHPIFDVILENKNLFITKQCAKSFSGYAYAQISKAKGQNKKQNWEKDKISRKKLLDFCYVVENEKSIVWEKWCETHDILPNIEKFCGVVNIPNARDLYAVYFDSIAYNCFSENIQLDVRTERIENRKKNGDTLGFGYKGIVKSEEGESISESNQLRLSSIPFGENILCNIIYNKDAYTQHCRDYKSYQTWLDNKNDARWVDVKSHDQKIDGKNMMHCMRLLQMAHEIAEGKGINVRRENAQELIDIRKGKVDLNSLIDKVENEIEEINDLFKNSTLPNDVDNELINKLIIKIRKQIYKL